MHYYYSYIYYYSFTHSFFLSLFLSALILSEPCSNRYSGVSVSVLCY